MGFLDKAKQAAEQAKTAAEKAADRANDAVEDVQTKRELTKAYGDLGETAFRLADSGAISHPELEEHVTAIRALQAKLDEQPATEPDPTEAVEQPLSGAGPGAA
jgi:multidrug resistance efflux pump